MAGSAASGTPGHPKVAYRTRELSAPRVMDRERLAQLVRWLHVLVIGFVILAPMMPFAIPWRVMIVLAPAMHLQWRLNQDRCLLTDLENALIETRDEDRASSGEPPSSEETFVGRLLEPVFGEISDAQVDLLSYGILWLSFAGSTLRLFLA